MYLLSVSTLKKVKLYVKKLSNISPYVPVLISGDCHNFDGSKLVRIRQDFVQVDPGGWSGKMIWRSNES